MIAREGWPPITSFGVATLALTLLYGPFWALPGGLLVAFLVAVYRYPKRDVPALPLAVVSPVDGRVVMARQVSDPWLERPALCIGIRMKTPGITPIRSPTEGKVMEFWTQSSTCLSTLRDSDRANAPVSCYALWVRTDEGDDIVIAVSASRFMSRFKSDVAPGERIGQGHRNGFVYRGTQVDVLLPVSTRSHVSEGQQTLAGCGVIATLVHR